MKEICPLFHTISLLLNSGTRKKRRMERINKLQKKIIGHFLGFFFPNIITFIIKNLSSKTTDLCGHILVNSQFSHTLFSHLSCLTFIWIHTAKCHAMNMIIKPIPFYVQLSWRCLPYACDTTVSHMNVKTVFFLLHSHLSQPVGLAGQCDPLTRCIQGGGTLQNKDRTVALLCSQEHFIKQDTKHKELSWTM